MDDSELTAQDTPWIDIARDGTFIDSLGRPQTITDNDLDTLVATFNETERRVPLVFGHPKTSAPAYGWVQALRRSGNLLQARFKQVHDDVKTLVNKGHFKNVSMALTADKTQLAHVGLLGAVQPAISGLREVAFSSPADTIVIEFNTEPSSELDRLRAELEQTQAQLRAQQKKEAAAKREQRLHDFKETVNAGKVMPWEMSQLLPFAEALLDADTMIQFSTSAEPVHAVDALTYILNLRPDSMLSVNFGQFATPRHILERGKEDAAPTMPIDPAYII